jgi:PhnB protein
MFWGDRFGVLSDPYGHVWSVATNVRKLTDDEIQRGAAAAAAETQPELERRRAAAR